MTYELAKQLKDAGFPHDWSDFEDHDPELLQADWGMYGPGYMPTLEELIEACGDGLSELVREPQSDGRISWWCRSKYPHEYQNHSTPAEAVAKLWLALKAVESAPKTASDSPLEK